MELTKTNNTSLSLFESNEVKNNPIIQSAFSTMSRSDLQDFKLSILDALGTKEIAECPLTDIIAIALKSNAMGLPISKELGLAYIIAYKGRATLVPAVKGIKALAMATGLIKVFNEGIVYEGELTNFNKMTGEFDLSGKRTSDKILGYFAYIELVNGFKKPLYLSEIDAKAHALKYSKEKDYNTSQKKMPAMWINEFDKMSIKTVVKMLLKSVPLLSKGLKGRNLQNAMAEDDNIAYGMDETLATPSAELKDKPLVLSEEDFTELPFDTKETAVVDEELEKALAIQLKAGKHTGETLKQVLENDKSYIRYSAGLPVENNVTSACKLIAEKYSLWLA